MLLCFHRLSDSELERKGKHIDVRRWADADDGLSWGFDGKLSFKKAGKYRSEHQIDEKKHAFVWQKW